MNLVRYTFLSLALPLAVPAVAQPITLVAPGNVPVPSSATFMVHRGDYVESPAPGAAQNFDFTSLASQSTAAYRWLDPALIPSNASYPGAQFVLTNGGPDTLFYKATSNGLEQVGETRDITVALLGATYHLRTGYSNTVLALQLPITYGDPGWTDIFQGTVSVDGTTNERNGVINGSVDAWGTIQLPGGAGSVDVIRVNTRVNETIPLATGLGLINVSHVRHESAYYPLWGKFPVLRTVADTLSTTSPLPISIPIQYTEWLDSTATGLSEFRAHQGAMQLFPNPAAEQVMVAFAGAAGPRLQLRVTNALGAVVHEQQASGAMSVLDIHGWAPGVYHVAAIDRTGQRFVQRLVVRQ